MANPRTVINPFTKNEHRMRRNTRGTKWVTAGPSMVVKQNLDTEQRPTQPNHYKFSLLSDSNDGPTETRVSSSIRHETKPPSLSSKPSATNTKVSYQESPVVAPRLLDFSKLEQTWKMSDSAVPPRCSASTVRPEQGTKRMRKNQILDKTSDADEATIRKQKREQKQAVSGPTHWYRTAKNIYTAGPKGEGQKVWEAYQQTLGHKKAGNEPSEIKPPETMAKVKIERRPPCPLPPPTSPDGVLFPPLRPRTSHTDNSNKVNIPDRPDARRDSGFSSSIYGPPIAAERTVGSILDVSNAHLPFPRIDTAPKLRRTKDVPIVNFRQPAEKEESNSWWKHSPSRAPQSLKSKISRPVPLIDPIQDTTVNVTVERGRIAGPTAELPLPVTRTDVPFSQPPYVHEKTKETSRPSPRAFHLPAFHLSAAKSKRHGRGKANVDENDDAHSTHWHDKVVGPTLKTGKSLKQTAMETLDSVHSGRKKTFSGISFACQGRVDDGLDRYQVSEQNSSSDDEEDLYPEPLFYDKMLGRDKKLSGS
ncbi:hypothetical protein J4E80_009065 [Alternaria sp. BMP 0032]|nr:hypothetical protein J4E80_009065 [Alternaria sp. BMP 0032]